MRFFQYLPLTIMPFMGGCIAMESVHNVIANTKPKYQEPTTGETANLRAFYSDASRVNIYPNSKKLADIRNDKNGGSVATKRFNSGLMSIDYEAKIIGMPFTPSNQRIFAEYKVPAGRPFIISLHYSYSELQGNVNVTTSCRKRIYKVNFEANKNYGTYIRKDNRRCIYQIFEYQLDGSEKPLTNIELIK